MAVSNRERVGAAMDLLKDGLNPFVEREMKAAAGPMWLDQQRTIFGQRGSNLIQDAKTGNFDCQALLILMRDNWGQPPSWNGIFGQKLGKADRNLVYELIDVRNRWAHQDAFSADDAERALGSVARLLKAAGAAEQATAVEKERLELLRQRFESEARKEVKQTAATAIEGQPAASLRPWREVVTPHPDVASGRYRQAEFAADLGQVHRGDGEAEYSDPVEFFRRTFLTDGLTRLLTGALRRLTGDAGDPVVELQTNFGGGKTHAMLGLYHLFSGVAAVSLPGIEGVLQAAGVDKAPKANRAVLVGTAISPAQPRQKPDGTVTHTLWGELAWQIGGADGYSLVAESDARGVSPGAEALRDLFEMFGPCLILIDEWAAFARQLYNVDGLAAGSFDANLSFVQALTEAARQTKQTLVVAAIPSSDIEKGGQVGALTVERFKNVLGRMESAWRPATAEEGFEIVRRRLFQPIEATNYAARDAVARAFADLYRGQPGEFPPAAKEGDYERRLKAAYPIHPELFDRLYNDWGELDRFQRTRGVLRLMAAVIHTLWERQDGNLVILPASVPIDDQSVQDELTRYLDDPWVPVIEKDVDGPNSLPLQLDRANPNLGRYSACRRVARTIYVGSAPHTDPKRRGLDDRAIKLGCAQPGESVATFGDALRRLTDEATHVYVDGGRYWLSLQQNVLRVAQDRAAQQRPDDVMQEIRNRLRKAGQARGDFARVHVCPASTGDVPDERETRLVVLDPDHPHSARAADSAGRQAAAAMLEQRGTGPRLFRNALVFLGADRTRLSELEQAVRQYLAWKKIDEEHETLNLDAFQRRQAKQRFTQADETVDHRIPETYSWLLVPSQEAQGTLEWLEYRLQGEDGLAARAGRRLRADGLLVAEYAPTLLRRDLDKIPLWRDDHVPVKQLWDDYAQYLYLPRLKDGQVLAEAVQQGVARLTWETETFAYAERFDEDRRRYFGLRTGAGGGVSLEGGGLVVKPDAARRQLEADAAAERERQGQTTYAEPAGGSGNVVKNGSGTYQAGGGTAVTPEAPTLRRFHGTVEVSPLRMGTEAGRIAQEIIQHLATLPGSNVRVTLEIQADLPDGAPEQVVRIVSENSRTLKFGSFGFEER